MFLTKYQGTIRSFFVHDNLSAVAFPTTIKNKNGIMIAPARIIIH